MTRVFCCLLLLLFSFKARAQKSLRTSSQTSAYTYIYPIDESNLENLYKGGALDEIILKAPIDSFLTNKNVLPILPYGNYLKVYVQKNALRYSLIENRNASLRLLNNRKDLQFIVVDPSGKEIKNADVTVNGRKVSYDAKAGLFHANYPGKDEVLARISHDNLVNFTKVSVNEDYRRMPSPFKQWLLFKSPLKYIYPPLVRFYYSLKKEDPPYAYYRNRGRKNRQQATFSGFMVFNKPIYKPLDTVKFKAFILKGKRHIPADEVLSVRLNNSGVYKELGTVKPQNKGSYDFSFVLHDSLKLVLDRSYNVELYDKDEIYRSGNFRYEEYELKSVSFTMRGDKIQHSFKEAQSLFFKASDENGLNIMDGRVELLIRTNAVLGFEKEKVFVPDTLWKHTLKLDPLGETKLVLPDSIFPNADISYRVEALFLNANNEANRSQASFTYYERAKEDLKFELKHDSLYISIKDTSIKHKPIKLSAINLNSDTIQRFELNLPAAVKLNHYASEYEVSGLKLLDWFEPGDEDAGVSAYPLRTADSLFIKVENPRKVPFWYTVLQGNKIVDRGTATELDYRKPSKERGRTTFRYSFIWADESIQKSTDVQFAEKQLHLDIKQPLAISPGETAEIEVLVSDAYGNVVPDVDLTAYSLTSKFRYYAPPIPYFGKSYAHSKQKPQLEFDEGIDNKTVPLNWERWSRQYGLDSIEYFRFTHPLTEYRHTEISAEGITQISPFITDKGNIVPVEILYINEKPVYFSQAEQLERYAFEVGQGPVKLKFRLKDKLVAINNVKVAQGKKLVLSYNIDAPNHDDFQVSEASTTLSEYEASVLNRYMIKVVDTYAPRFATINQPDKVFLLQSSVNYERKSPEGKLVGPLSNAQTEFQIIESEPVPFLAEPNYSYTVRPGFLHQKSISGEFAFKTALNTVRTQSFTDYVLTNNEIDSLWINYLDLRSNSTSFFVNPRVYAKGNGKLEVKVKKSDALQTLPLIKNILVYNNDNPDFLNIYRGNETDLGYFVPGNYRVFVLFKGDNYVLVDEVLIKPDGRNLLAIPLDQAHKRDSVSIKISEFIKQRSFVGNIHESVNLDGIKEVFHTRFTNPTEYTEVMSGIVYSETDKLPLPGVLVTIKGTQFGVTTDQYGRFSINVPKSGKLAIRYIGYESQEINISSSNNIEIYLDEASQMLNEVVVVAYGAERKTSFTASLEGKVAGVSVEHSVNIRGNTSISGQGPLYIVDGVPMDKLASELTPDEIAEMTTLKDASATAIYGARGANGVIIITTRKGKEKAQQEAEAAGDASDFSIRRNFSDYAFWQPQLRTDKEGKARFNVTFPDDITNWRTFFIAMNDKRQSGFSENSIKSFKSLSASFVSPTFAITGDSISTIGKVMNYTTESASVTRDFSYNGKNMMSNSLSVGNAHIDTLDVIAQGTDSLKFRYSIQKESGYTDGEERSIPVFKAGVLENTGMFEVLEKDTAMSISFDPKMGEVRFYAEASVIPTLLNETEYLRNYEYLCNEQLASKVKALLVERKVKAYLKQDFEYDKLIKQLIAKLVESRRGDGTWGWWKNSESELWISYHVIEAFIEAEKAGFSIPLKKTELIDYLVYQLSRYSGQNKLHAMLLLQKLDAKVDYAAHLKLYELALGRSYHRLPLYEKFNLLLVKQQAGLPVSMDSVMAYKRVNMFGNMYFGDINYRMFDNSIQNTLLAYKIIKSEGKNPEWLSKIRNYLLQQRADGHWRNTYESSLILETLLPDILGGSQKPNPITLTLNAAQEVTTFPYAVTLDPAETLQVQKRGDLPLYITAYQQNWNAQPEKVSKDFKVDTWFEKSGSRVTALKGGQAVELKAEVNVSAEADYVMIEIPIPAGTSYDEKDQRWWGNEIHREYFKNKVAIFCRKLKEGKYTFSVKLMPRYDGNYTLNPAKAELMYFPVFYGREGMKKVEIGE